MKPLRRLWNRLTGTFAGSQRERELAAEIEAHLAMQMEDNVNAGMTPAEARRAARLKFGGVESMKEGYRDQRGLPLVAAFAQDVRYSFRAMRRDRAFTAAAVLSLALGMGATTAVFSVVDSLLLRSLPYRNPESLAAVSLDGAVTAPLFDALRTQSRSIESAALFKNLSLSMAGEGEPERIPAARVSAELFDLLGVGPELGRTFTPEEDRQSAAVVLIGDRLWKRRFGGDPRVLGRGVVLNGAAYTIVGVMPPGFEFPYGPELPSSAGTFPPAEMWRPMALVGWERTCAGCFNFAMIARLRPGVTPAQARPDLNAVLKRLAGASRQHDDPELTVRTLQAAVNNKVRTPVVILFEAVTLALLIACVNVANLLLARGLRRQAEIALRLSLGAGTGRVVRQLLTEAVILALCSAALAVPVAWAGIRALVAIAPAGIPRLGTIGLDARLLGFSLGLALLSAIVFGAAPALLTARRAPAEVLKTGGRAMPGRSSRLRAALVVAEFALSLVLLIGSGLLVKSFLSVARTPLGFHAEDVLTMQTVLPEARYKSHARGVLIDRIVAQCAGLPGVTAAAAVSTLPLTSASEGWGLLAEGNPDTNAWVAARVRAITPGYFRTMGIPLRAGREFNAGDQGAIAVAIVSAAAARKLWPGVADPLGRRIQGRPAMAVVGIVEDTRASGLDSEVLPYLYLPFAQFSPEDFAVAVRSTADPVRLAAAVKSEIWRVDKDQPVTHVATVKQLVADAVAPRRFQALAMTVFAAFALALAAIGIYGVLSYSVAQRTHEIGVRMAVGASRWNVVWSVMREAGGLAATAAVLGLSAAGLLTPVLETRREVDSVGRLMGGQDLLYGIGAAKPWIFGACALLLLAVALAASLVPAHRASRLDPIQCLRHE